LLPSSATPPQVPQQQPAGTTFDAPVVRGSGAPSQGSVASAWGNGVPLANGSVGHNNGSVGVQGSGAAMGALRVEASVAATNDSTSSQLRRGVTAAPRFRPLPHEADDYEDMPVMASTRLGADGEPVNGSAAAAAHTAVRSSTAVGQSQDMVQMSSPPVSNFTSPAPTFGAAQASPASAPGSATPVSAPIADGSPAQQHQAAATTSTSVGTGSLSHEQRAAIVNDLFSAAAARPAPAPMMNQSLTGSGRLQAPARLQLQVGDALATAGVSSPGHQVSSPSNPLSARRRQAEVTTTLASPSSPAARRALQLDAAVDAPPPSRSILSNTTVAEPPPAAASSGRSAWGEPEMQQTPPRSLLSWGAPGAASAGPSGRASQPVMPTHTPTRTTWQVPAPAQPPAAAQTGPSAPTVSNSAPAATALYPAASSDGRVAAQTQAVAANPGLSGSLRADAAADTAHAGTSMSSFEFGGSSGRGAGSTPGMSFADYQAEAASSSLQAAAAAARFGGWARVCIAQRTKSMCGYVTMLAVLEPKIIWNQSHSN
jgi:ribonuclease E